MISQLGEGFKQTRLQLDTKLASPQTLGLLDNPSQSGFIFLRYFLPVVILIGFGGYFYAETEIRLKQQELRAADQEAVKLATHSLQAVLIDMTGDILFLSKLPRLTIAVNNPTPQNLSNLEETWSVYMESQGSYDQIRWIDENGIEKVRVNYDSGHAQRIPAAELQDKSQRSFFIQTSSLNEGDIYLSKLDLNIEHEQVDIPYKPVIRIAMPLFTADGQRRGMIVVNFHGQELLNNLVNASGKRSKQLVMVNREGYFLFSRNTEDLWGFMLNKPTTLGNKDATAWASIQNSEQGNLTTSNGTWSWDSIHPLDIIRTSYLHAGRPPQIIKGENEYFWHVAMLRPMSELQTISQGIWRRTAIPMGLLTLLGLITCISLTRSKVKIAQLDNQLKERAQVAESATLAKSQFLANMSHEIRTPMNAILGLAYILEKTTLPGDANDLAHKIRTAGQSLLGIINDTLDFSKIESGKFEMESAPFCLNDVLDNLSVIMSANASEKDLELIISTPQNRIY